MIYVYAGITPNFGQSTHIIFDDYAKYNTWLGKPAMTFAEGRYTLNGNVAEISIPAGGDWRKLSYLAWNNSGVWSYYFVRSQAWQSGCVILNLEPDLWASYLPMATIANIRINRCNRLIGTGVYDDIPVTYNETLLRLDDSDLPETGYSIVFTVVMATGNSTILANNAGTAIATYALSLGSISTPDPKPVGFSRLLWAVDYVSGIVSSAATVGTLDANVIKAYIVPTNMIPQKTVAVPQFNYVGKYGKGTFSPNFEVDTAKIRKYVSFTVDPNYKYYVGTRLAGLEITRVTGTVGVYYNFIAKQDGLQVIITQGDRMLDITDAFSIGLTSNDGNFTAMQRVNSTLQMIGGLASAGFQVAAGGAGYVTGAISAVNALTSVVRQGNARYTSGGDGLSNIAPNLSIEAPPYYAIRYQSISDEQAHARLYGVTYNKQVTSIDNIFDRDLIGSGDLTNTLIAADMRIDDIPLAARDVITDSFASGVYCIKI